MRISCQSGVLRLPSERLNERLRYRFQDSLRCTVISSVGYRMRTYNLKLNSENCEDHIRKKNSVRITQERYHWPIRGLVSLEEVTLMDKAIKEEETQAIASFCGLLQYSSSTIALMHLFLQAGE